MNNAAKAKYYRWLSIDRRLKRGHLRACRMLDVPAWGWLRAQRVRVRCGRSPPYTYRQTIRSRTSRGAADGFPVVSEAFPWRLCLVLAPRWLGFSLAAKRRGQSVL